RDNITTVNFKAEGKSKASGHKHDRLLVNPSKPRMLEIDGKKQLCVLTWFGVHSAAWMRVIDLVDGPAIADVAHPRALKEDPEASSHDEEKLARETTHYVIRNDSVGESTPGDSPHGKDKVFGPGDMGGDDVPHYLTKDERKNAFDSNGKATGGIVTRSLVAL